MTTAGDLLSSRDPQQEFMSLVSAATGGALVLDECGLFDPAPKGRTANDSNKVLDSLLRVTALHSKTTTFILAGSKQELARLLAYHPTFPSRFPKHLQTEFADFDTLQLTRILIDMTLARGFRFLPSSKGGVKIPIVLGRRLARGANRIGFGNGRSCEALIDQCVQSHLGRLSRAKAADPLLVITDAHYRTLLPIDTIGPRPDLTNDPSMLQLSSMVGLRRVKRALGELMHLQLQNWDAEMRGEGVQQISLHRVFLGSAGTGKVCVDRLCVCVCMCVCMLIYLHLSNTIFILTPIH